VGRSIRITAGAVSVPAELNDSTVASAIFAALPLERKAETWGDEIYFDIGVTARSDSPRETVTLGDLGYWPPGRAFCIFFGPTPMSAPGEIRPASAVEVVGRVAGDPTVFKRVRTGTLVRLERSDAAGDETEGRPPEKEQR
jgi:hypothetical protein